MNNEIMIDTIRYDFKTIFPHSWIIVHDNVGITRNMITITFGLVDPGELQAGILANDPMYHTFLLLPCSTGFAANINMSGISVQTTDLQHSFDTVKTPFRKVSGDHATMIRTFQRLFNQLHDLIQEHDSNIYRRKAYLNKYFED